MINLYKIFVQFPVPFDFNPVLNKQSTMGIHVTPWLTYVNVWQNPLQCCEVISLQLIKINKKKKPINQSQMTKIVIGNLINVLKLLS